MKKNKKIEEYEALYGNIPEDYNDRLLHLMKELNINKKDLANIRSEIERIKNIKTYKIDFTFYFVPKATPRPRNSRFSKVFYVKKDIDYSELFRIFIEECTDIDFKIVTPSIFKCKTYFPMPSNMSKMEKVLAELGLIPYISKPDWDNLGKTYSDMVQKHFIVDDSLMFKGETEKYYSTKPRIEISIEFLSEFDSKYNRRKVEKWNYM